MDYIARAERILYSVSTLRIQFNSYINRLNNHQRGSDSDTTTDIDVIKQKMIETKEAIDIIVSIVNQLSTDDQSILRLWYFEKLSKKEIANHLLLSESTAYRQKEKALRRFIDIYPW